MKCLTLVTWLEPSKYKLLGVTGCLRRTGRSRSATVCRCYAAPPDLVLPSSSDQVQYLVRLVAVLLVEVKYRGCTTPQRKKESTI